MSDNIQNSTSSMQVWSIQTEFWSKNVCEVYDNDVYSENSGLQMRHDRLITQKQITVYNTFVFMFFYILGAAFPCIICQF